MIDKGIKVSSKAVHTGLNRDKGSYNDNHYWRCSRCGFIVNIDRHLQRPQSSHDGDGYGEAYTLYDTDYNYNNSLTYDGTNVTNRDVNGGCPFCGTLRYRR